MEDHVQLHRSWMSRFSHSTKDGDKVYCFNVGQGTIDDGVMSVAHGEINCVKIKKLGTLPNYYNSDFEKYLSRFWETKFGELLKHITTENDKGNAYIHMDDSNIDFLKEFIAICISRSKFINDETEKILSPLGVKIEREIFIGAVASSKQKMFSNATPIFLRNETTIGFVLPSICYYYVAFANVRYPVVVINDKLAICFIEGIIIDKNNPINVISIDDEENIKQYNHCALLVEVHTNNQYLIAKNITDLEQLGDGN